MMTFNLSAGLAATTALFATAFVVSATDSAADLKQDFPKAKALVIKNILGETQISKSLDGATHVQLTKVSFSEKCALKFAQVGDTVEVRVEKSGWFSSLNGSDCHLNVSAQVPALAKLSIGQTAGKIEIMQVNVANVEVDAVSATVNIDAEVARVTAKTVSGAISVHAATAKDVFMKSVSGELELDAESSRPAVELVTVSGSAVMRATQAPQITFKSVSGHLVSKAMTGTGDGAPVNFKSVSGSLTIQ